MNKEGCIWVLLSSISENIFPCININVPKEFKARRDIKLWSSVVPDIISNVDSICYFFLEQISFVQKENERRSGEVWVTHHFREQLQGFGILCSRL